MELATVENTLFELDPIKRIVPTTITRITASITAYSAMSCPCSSLQSLRISSVIVVFSCTRNKDGGMVLEPRLGTIARLAPPLDYRNHTCNSAESDNFLQHFGKTGYRQVNTGFSGDFGAFRRSEVERAWMTRDWLAVSVA
jgi:hypothetical protein